MVLIVVIYQAEKFFLELGRGGDELHPGNVVIFTQRRQGKITHFDMVVCQKPADKYSISYWETPLFQIPLLTESFELPDARALRRFGQKYQCEKVPIRACCVM